MNNSPVKPSSMRSLLQENWRLASGMILFSGMPLIFSSVLAGWLLLNHESVSLWVADAGSTIVLLSGLTMAAGLTPTTFVAIVTGFFFGFQGVLFLIVAYIFASALGYGIGRLLDGGHFIHSLKTYPVAQKVAKDIAERPAAMLILARLSPALPFCLMNLLMSALKVPFVVYLLAGAAGMLPRTLLSLWIGSQSRDFLTLLESGGSQQEALWMGIGTVITVSALVWIVIRRVQKVIAAS